MYFRGKHFVKLYRESVCMYVYWAMYISLCLPTAVIPILKLTASQRVMTNVFKNSTVTNIVCWAISFIVIGFNVHLVIDYLDELQWPLYAMVFCVLYFSFVLYLIYIPLEIPDTKEDQIVAEQDLQ